MTNPTTETEDVVGLIEQLQRLLAGFAGENDLKVGPHMLAHGIEEALAAIQSLSERIAVLEGVLEPFTRGPDHTSLAKLYAHLNRVHYLNAKAALRASLTLGGNG